jgi:hypothetical protein
MFSVHELRAQQQVEERSGVEAFDFLDGPIVSLLGHW